MAIVDVNQLLDEELGPAPKKPAALDVNQLLDEELGMRMAMPQERPAKPQVSRPAPTSMPSEDSTPAPSQEAYRGIGQALKDTAISSMDLAVAMLPGAGSMEAGGAGIENPVSAALNLEEARPIPSMAEDIEEGRNLDATFKGIGVAGDVATAGGLTMMASGAGFIPGAFLTAGGVGMKAVSKYGDDIADGLRKLFDMDNEAAIKAAERADKFVDDGLPVGAAINMIKAETRKTKKAKGIGSNSLVTAPNRVTINIEPDEAGLYSRLDASMNDAPAKGNARQWLKYFRDQGIRTDELSLRLPEITDDVNSSFTLEEVQAMLRDRPITIRDRELSFNPNSAVKPSYDVDLGTGELNLIPGSDVAAARLGDVAGAPQYGSFGLVIPDKQRRVTNMEIALGDAEKFNYREFPVQVTSDVKRGVSTEINEDQARLIDETELAMADADIPLLELDEDIMDVVRMKHRALKERGLGFDDVDEFYEAWAEHHFFDYIVEYAQGDAMTFMEMTTSAPQIAGIIADIELRGGGDIFARKFREAVEELGVLPTQSANMLKTLTSSVPVHRQAMSNMEAAIRSRAAAQGQNDQSIINQLDQAEPSEVYDRYLEALQGDVSQFDYEARHFEGTDAGSNFAKNTVAHYRATDRAKDDKEILFVEEVQSDAFGSDKADMPVGLPGRDNNYQRMVLALAVRRAVLEGYDGIAFANADQVRNVNGRSVFTQYENIDVTTRTGEKATSFIKNSTQDRFFRSNVNPNEFTQADYDAANSKITPNADARDRLYEIQMAFVRRIIAQGDVKVVKLRKTGSGESPHYALFDRDGLFIGSSDRNIFERANEIQQGNDGARRASTTQIFGGAVGGEIMANRRLKMDASFNFGAVNDGYTDVYDRAMPKRVDEFLRAMGNPVKKTTLDLDDVDGENMAIEFTDEFKELVINKGVPMMRKGGLASRK